MWRKDARGRAFVIVFPGIARVAHALTHSWFDLRPVLAVLCCWSCAVVAVVPVCAARAHA